MRYDEASSRLGTRASRKVANNTYLQRRDDSMIAVKLHDTDIVVFKTNGDVILNSGGWKTPTTKDRMNSYAPGRISQAKGVWWYCCGNWSNPAEVIPYADGMTIHADGTISGQGEDPKKDIKLRRDISKYSKGFISALQAGKVPKPGNGDCWYCLMRDTSNNKPLGESSNNPDHLQAHMEEKYYVPSLLVRALEVMPCSQAMRWAIGEKWFQVEGKEPMFNNDSFLWQQITKSLSRYIMRQFGLVS